MKKLKKLVINAVILTLASLLLRTVALSFNVYISNKIGAEGVGLFSLIGSVYSFALTFATSGISIAATRLTSSAIGKNDAFEVRTAMKKCFIYSGLFGSFALVILFLLSPTIGSVILKDTRTVTPLRFFSFTLPLISTSSAMSGYFVAVRRVYKNAAAQIFEQAVKITLTVYTLGILNTSSIERACTAIVASGAVAELGSFLFLFAEYSYDKKKHLKPKRILHKNKYLTRELLSIALPTAFSSYARSGLSTIEHILIPKGLEQSGATRDNSLATYGMLHSMVLPIVLFPSAIISSFSGLLVPEITECKVKENEKEIDYIISRTFQVALLFSIGVAGILMCFSGELGIFIYDNSEAGHYIRLIAPLVPIMYMDTATDAILKGLGEQVYTMNVNLIDSALGVILVMLLLPSYGVNGYIALIFICETVNATLGVSRLLYKTNFRFQIIRNLLGPLFCIIGATSCIRILSAILHLPHLSSAMDLTFCIVITSLLYFSFAAFCGCISKDDIRWLSQIIKK